MPTTPTIPTTMTAAVWTAADTMSVRELPVPEVPQGWALVRVLYNGICGTDLAIVHGAHPRAAAGLVPGHEIVGTVVAPGEGGPEAGATVVVEPLISCGDCRACRSGATHVCRDLQLYGIDAPGGLAEYVALPPSVLHRLPDGVDPRVGALVEPLAVAVHAVSTARVGTGDVVAVAGGGPIGVLTALVARHAGAAQAIVSEPSAWRRSVLADLGLTVVPADRTLTDVVLEHTAGEGSDITFDAAGHPAVTPELTAATRVLGSIVVVGVHKKPAPVDLQAVCFKELSVRGVRVYTRADVVRAIELVAEDALGLARVPVQVFPLAEVSAAVTAAADGGAALKVLVAPAGDLA
ncbi:zinc-binding dehydrogenase [Promicromonospora vindobonensis]|uniref:Zinc-binding dehydrogenase n=1 Tax=Promicromonospora vindobonensis TaxID=195748 RepID=A0ABW5W3Y6_9MICO